MLPRYIYLLRYILYDITHVRFFKQLSRSIFTAVELTGLRIRSQERDTWNGTETCIGLVPEPEWDPHPACQLE